MEDSCIPSRNADDEYRRNTPRSCSQATNGRCDLPGSPRSETTPVRHLDDRCRETIASVLWQLLDPPEPGESCRYCTLDHKVTAWRSPFAEEYAVDDRYRDPSARDGHIGSVRARLAPGSEPARRRPSCRSLTSTNRCSPGPL